jgi:hypothetical protein
MTAAESEPEPSASNPPAARPDRALLVVVGVVLVLVLVALVVVFTRGEPAQLEEGSPGGVVQRYSAAALDGDDAVAGEYLSPSALADCDSAATPDTDDTRITLVDVDERESSADVRVSIVTSYDGGAFGSSEYESEDAFELVKVGGDWLIERAPWQLTVCPSPATGVAR